MGGGAKKHPIILHCSPSGAIERIIYALLEKAFMDTREGRAPMLPLWLSPTQVRVVPVSENFMGYAVKIVSELEKQRVRVDLDDRSETIGGKIRDAEREWIPYIIVVGEREARENKITVRVRGSREQKTMMLDDLAEEIKKKINGKPFRPLPLPKNMSERPKFVG